MVCGPHLVRPCQVVALKQVRSQVESQDLLFVVMMTGPKDETMFLTSQQIMPLLNYWGIPPEEVPPIAALPPEVRNRIHERMRGIRVAERKIKRAQRRASKERVGE